MLEEGIALTPALQGEGRQELVFEDVTATPPPQGIPCQAGPWEEWVGGATEEATRSCPLLELYLEGDGAIAPGMADSLPDSMGPA